MTEIEITQEDIALAETHYPPDCWRREAIMDLAGFLATARQAARERALDEAAEVADVEGRRNQFISDDFKRGDTNRNSAWNQMVASDRIASHIRKLKEA